MIKLRKNLIEYYKQLDYDVTNNKILVKSEDLHKGANIDINVICDNCGKEKSIKCKAYYQSIKKYGNYYCVDCKYERIKNSNLKKYGVENVMQLLSVKNKMLETQKEVYGDIKILDKTYINNILINKYGSLKNYYSYINDKKKKSNIDKYGVDNVMKYEPIKEKAIQTLLNRYGVENPMLVDKFIKKSTENQLKTKIKRNTIISDDKLSDFQKYKKIIRRLIYKYKQTLFENWNGYDYYDNEYIKDNLNLYHTHKNYPTIDHKVSVYNGFIENIEPHIIGDISNLCITKRCINSSKHIKNSYSKKEINK